MAGKLLQPLLLAALLAACNPVPESALQTIESADAGLRLREMSPQSLKSVGLPYGLAVVKAAGLAERAGLRIGDVVYGINQKKVRSAEELMREFAQELSQGSSRVGLLVRRGATDFYVAVDLGGSAPPRDAPPRPAPGSRETLLRT